MTIARCETCGAIMGFCLCAVRAREAAEAAEMPLGRNLDRGECPPARCFYGTCGGSPNPCGGCCRCLGCQIDYEGKQVRHQYRVSDRGLVRLLAALRKDT